MEPASAELSPDERGVRFALDSPLEEDGFELVWGFSLSSGCFRFIVSSLFGAGRAVLHPVACDQVPGARAWCHGTETLAKLGASRLAALVFRSALTPEHAERG